VRYRTIPLDRLQHERVGTGRREQVVRPESG
jgi:hypothetical protein